MMHNDYRTIYRLRLRRYLDRRPLSRWVTPGVYCGGFLAGIALVLAPQLLALVNLGPAAVPETVAAAPEPAHPDRDELAGLFSREFFLAPAGQTDFSATMGGQSVHVATTIDPGLQEQLQSLFAQAGALLAAGVVIDARSGAVLAMGADPAAGPLPIGDAPNYCLSPVFPAASLIKIITAAAVVEKKGFSCSNTLPVSGRFYTLYKHQLGLARQRYRPQPISLEKAFSKSINPFFGQLGIDYLSVDEFSNVARALLFDADIDFDLPLPPSTTFTPATKFEQAELACGFNARTTISPLHAALLAAMVANDGRIMQPYLVQHVTGADGRELFRHDPAVLSEPLARESVAELRRMMNATVRYGTARKSFSPLRRLRGREAWDLGGKTGAINIPSLNRRCEWFSGFAESTDMDLAVAIVIVHKELRTQKPSWFAARLIRECIRHRAPKTLLTQSDPTSSAG